MTLNKPNLIIRNLEVIASYKKLSTVCLQEKVDFDQTLCGNDHVEH